MPRKGPVPKRPVVVDPVYGSPLVSQLVTKILLNGKKTTAQSIVYGALEGTRAKTGVDPVQTLKKALDNIRPSVEVKSRRVGGATYQVPVEVKPARATTLALRCGGYARQRREKTMTERLMSKDSRCATVWCGEARTPYGWPSNRAFAHTAGKHVEALSPGGEAPMPRRSRTPDLFIEETIRGHRHPRQPGKYATSASWPHRRGQDDNNRADSLLHRHQLQAR